MRKTMIYLDNAATTLRKPPEVAEAVVKAMREFGNCARGVHAGSLGAAHAVFGARDKLAELFGCPSPECVAFAANATEALNTAICGLIRPGDHVISTDCEHNSVLRPLYRLEDEGTAALSFVGADAKGNLRYEEFEELIRPETRAIVCTHASNLTGNLTDLKRVSETAKKHGILLIADCSQTAGCMPVNMSELGIDVLCFTGHKGLMGPQGTGGLCVRPGLSIRPMKVGGTGVQSHSRTQPAQMPAVLEAGTLNSHGIAGLGAAADFLLQTGVRTVHERETCLMQRFCRDVREIPGITVYGDFSRDRCAIAALNLEGMDSGEFADILSEEYGIAVRAGLHCAPRMHKALGTYETGAVRFSFSWYSTEEEADTAAAAVREIAESVKI